MKGDNMFTNKELKRLIVPLIIEQILAVTVGMADVIMVSRVGEAAVSGVSLVDMINVLIINIFAALATGGAVITAQFIGKQKKELACRSVNQLFFSTAVISVTVMAVVLLFRHGLLRLFFGSIDDDVMGNALVYLVLSACSYPFLAVYNSGAAVFRSMGNSKVPMLISLMMNIVNIGGNAVFIFGFRMGVAGAATASLISRMMAAAVVFILLRQQKHEVHLARGISEWKPDFYLIKKILYIGIPNGLENSFFQLGRVLVVSIISCFGTVQIAANAVANNIDSLGVLPGQAISYAMITVVGQCVGAGDFKQAREYGKKLLGITYAVTFGLGAVVLTALPWILKIYNLSPETLKLATVLIFIHNGCAMLMWPASFVLPNALRAANDVNYTMGVSIFSMLVFRILFSYIIGLKMGYGAVGVWIAMIMDWIFRMTMFLIRFSGNKWQTHRI